MDSAQGGSGLPRWTLLALVPFVVLAACAIYLRIHWNDIPMRFPVHWGANGPNRWETRSFLGVYSGLIFAAGLSASLIGAGLMSYFGSGRARAGELMLRVMVGVGCFLGLVFAGVALMPLGFRPGISRRRCAPIRPCVGQRAGDNGIGRSGRCGVAGRTAAAFRPERDRMGI